MSETLTSHTQWIQHAVAAAKAGNPSVAKIQLQKAAEEAPGDPAIWLWMGWLADSPASAAQCLEIARSDARFEKIAVAGIEFARALADFQLDQFSETDTESSDENETAVDVAEQNDSVKDPVEAVEEVVAAVESLQQEDTTDPVVDDVVEESVGDDPVAPHSDADAVSVEVSIETPAVDEPKSELDEAISNDVAVENLDAVDNRQPELSSDNDVEAELMQSANELWQTADEMAVETLTSPEKVARELQSDQQLWQSVVDEPTNETVSPPAPEVSPQPATAAVRVPEIIIDESEDDFAFAGDDSEEAEFGAVIPPPIEPSPVNVSVNPSLSARDQWLGHESVETSQAPVWRKAQSDWFSVDGSSEPEPAPESVNSVDVSPISATPVDQVSQLKIEHVPSAADSTASIPRVTPSDV